MTVPRGSQHPHHYRCYYFTQFGNHIAPVRHDPSAVTRPGGHSSSLFPITRLASALYSKHGAVRVHLRTYSLLSPSCSPASGPRASPRQPARQVPRLSWLSSAGQCGRSPPARSAPGTGGCTRCPAWTPASSPPSLRTGSPNCTTTPQTVEACTGARLVLHLLWSQHQPLQMRPEFGVNRAICTVLSRLY